MVERAVHPGLNNPVLDNFPNGGAPLDPRKKEQDFSPDRPIRQIEFYSNTSPEEVIREVYHPSKLSEEKHFPCDNDDESPYSHLSGAGGLNPLH